MRKFVALSAILLAVSACGGDKPKKDRGIKYMPDMYQSPALKAQEAYVVEEKNEVDGTIVRKEIPAMFEPVGGTIPRDFIPYDVNTTEEEANKLQNPLAPTADVLRQGRDHFNTFCAVCHGKDGNALDNSYVGDKFLGIPNLNTSVVDGYTDGIIYHWITLGKGRMPNYRAQLFPGQRWAVVHYIRALYDAQEKGVDLNLDEAERLDAAGKEFQPLPEPVPDYKRNVWVEKGEEAAK